VNGEGIAAVPMAGEQKGTAGAPQSRWVHVNRRVAAPPARVFAAWTVPSELACWFPFAVAGSLEPGARAVLQWPDRSTWWEMIRTVPGRELSFRWPWLANDAWRTVVTVRLHAMREGTLVSLEDGPFDVAEPALLDAYAEATGGWTEALAQLRAYLDFGIDLRVH
jgi:uncharacterized protein YndB with AHSA1/START domain